LTVPGVGPKPCKIMFVAEAPGKEEDEAELPLVGSSGRLFNQTLSLVGISRPSCYITNVIQERPPNNDILKFCVGKKDLPPTYLYSPLAKGKYLHPDYLSSLPRLAKEIREANPNVIVAMGNLSTWALLGAVGISKIRGAVAACSLVSGKKVIPTYHPAFVLRAWHERITFNMDLQKAKRESEFPEIRREERVVAIELDLQDIRNWITENHDAEIISADIETADGFITCISFAASRSSSIVVPFRDMRKSDGNYWADFDCEVCAWKLVEEILMLPGQKLFQNGCYDLQYLFRTGLTVRNCTADTMLLHHSLYPEMKKSLGYMGSLYCNEASWKLMHRRSGEELKKEE
jgi:uracil-DNA glycosylase